MSLVTLPRLCLFLLLACAAFPLTLTAASVATRPSIWVTPADREAILRKIEAQPWAKAQYDALVERSQERLAIYQADPDAYLRTLPWQAEVTSGHPVLTPITVDMASAGRTLQPTQTQAILGHAIDCAVLHYLTGDPALAAIGGDVLQALVKGLLGLKPDENPSNGGWLYTKDHLYEARVLGAQIPILYDLVATHLRQPGVRVWDLETRRRVPFDFQAAQQVFRTYTRLAVEHGNSDTNWPVLEMPSLTHNALALDDPEERARWLQYVTHVDTPRQASLEKVVRRLNEAGGVWPESYQYANDVAMKVTYVVTLLERQPPGLKLPQDIGIVSRSMVRLRDFRFPSGELVRWGDGMRLTGLAVRELEMAYSSAVRAGDAVKMAEFGGVVREAMEVGPYDRSRLGEPARGAQVYLSPLSLLWFEPEIVVPPRVSPPPRTTDELPFAGLVLQRNLAPDGKPEHGLMAAVHGSSYVHSHASGMSLELHVAGHALATNAGKGTYRSDEHENHRRIFAAHNSVIVNGASASSGRWANLGIDTVKPVALEPAFGAQPVSPRHSFTLTRFTDRQVGGGTAEQERTVGIVRTSDLGGYYVDIFRSRAAEPGQFHDYVLHQVGDRVEWRSPQGALEMTPVPERFKPFPGTSWKQNGTFLFPGWHFFENAELAAAAEGTHVADFLAERLGGAGVGARLHVPHAPGREYTRATGPETLQAPGGYDKQRTPLVVIRQKGEAWTKPFAVVHEPYRGSSSAAGIREVRALEAQGGWQGLVVSGTSAVGDYRHYVLAPDPDTAEVRSAELGLGFSGRYAWISVDERGEPIEIYLGRGTVLTHRGVSLRRADGAEFSARAERTAEGWRITSPDSAGIQLSLSAPAL